MEKTLQIKITLRGSKPPIWRRLLIENNITFLTFHYIIQDAMGWENAHLFEFKAGHNRICEYYEEWDMGSDMKDAAEIMIDTVLNKKGDKVLYTYDFGDGWEHQITVEKVETIDKSVHYPVCIKGKGNCPPEDCGGIWGFYSMLEALKDKKHPEYEHWRGWMEADYDPDNFDMISTNELLGKHSM